MSRKSGNTRKPDSRDNFQLYCEWLAPSNASLVKQTEETVAVWWCSDLRRRRKRSLDCTHPEGLDYQYFPRRGNSSLELRIFDYPDA